MQCLHEPLAAGAKAIQLCGKRSGGECSSCSNFPPGCSPFAAHSMCPPQISMFALAAVCAAVFYLLDYRLLRWRIAGKEVDGDRVWKNLRRFSSWMFAGCVAGAVAFAAWMQWRYFDYESTEFSGRQFYVLQASSGRYYVVFHIFYPVQLLCVIFAMNTLLRRVSDHASHSYYNTVRDLFRAGTLDKKRFDWRDCIGQYALYYWVRSMHKIAMAICVLHAIARVVASGFWADVAARSEEAAAASEITGRSNKIAPRSDAPVTVSRCLEAAVLVFVAVGFLMIFPATIVMFHRVQRKMDGLIQEMSLRTDQGNAMLPFEFSPRAADGSETQTEMPITEARQYMRDIRSAAAAQRWRFFFCLVFVTAALVALACNAVFIASSAIRTQNPDCGSCGPCQTLEFLVAQSYIFTPEIAPLVASLSSTLPLVFSLWLMTTPEDRDLLMNPSKFRSEEVVLHPTDTSRNRRLMAERIRLGIYIQ